AEDIKIAIGSAYPLDEEVTTFFRGRDLLTGLPRSIEVTSAQIREALDPSVEQIVDAIKDTIEETPPELVADVMDQGIYLAGGGALLRDPAVVRGAAAGAPALLVPVERVLGAIGAPVSHAWPAVTEIETLRSDDAALRAENDRLTLENVQLQEQAFSARQAAQLAAAAKALSFKTVSAPVIARDPSGLLHIIILGAGSKDGVLLDDVVISDQGVVGRVSVVGATYSKVLLVTDTGSSVSALVQGSRAAGLVRGQFGDTLVMD